MILRRPSTLAAITGGYAYTLVNGTVEKYNSSSQLFRIEYPGGGALNLFLQRLGTTHHHRQWKTAASFP